MRTRSQPASPGGLVSLEDMQRATRRVTRATRSASRGVSQEPSSQQSSSQQPTEPETQPTTRSKSKKTTTKKSTAATSNTKPQTRKGSKRETRSTIQKTNQAASDEAQPSIEENHLDTARDDDEDSTEVGTQEHKSGPSTSDASQLEPKNAEREYHTSLSPSQISLSLFTSPSRLSLQPLSDPHDFQESQEPEGDPSPRTQSIMELQQIVSDWEQFRAIQESNVPMEPSPLDEFDDFFLTLPTIPELPDIGETPVPSYWDLEFGERDQIESAISRLNSPLPFEFGAFSTMHTIDMPEFGEELANILDGAAVCSIAMAPTESPRSPATSEQVDATEPTAVEPKELEQSHDSVAGRDESANQKEIVSPLASSVDSEEQTAVEDKCVNELAEIFAKLSLSNVVVSHEAAEPSTESTTVPEKLPELEPASVISPVITGNAFLDVANTRQPALLSNAPATTFSLASIYDDDPPSIPVMELLAPARRVQQLTLFSGEIPDSPFSIYEYGQAPPNLDITERQQSVEEPLAPVVLEEEPGLIAGPPLRPSRVKSNKWRVSQAQRRGWADTPLSPIPEEIDLGPPSSSSVAPNSPATPSHTTPVECSPVHVIPSEHSLPPFTTPKRSLKISYKGAAKSSKPSKTPKTPQTSRSKRTPKTPGALKTPSPPKIQHPSEKTEKKKLTKKIVNRKRSRTKTSPDSAEPVTPYANKRRNLGPPGSTPFMRRHTNLTRRFTTSLAERKRRRTAESQGRIHSTIFRLPQLVAQTEADRRASETTALTPPSEPLQPNLNLSSEQAELDDQAASEETTATAQEPSTPESVSRSWKISGLLNSVPRSFSRFLPRFGRSRATSEIPATQQPASERIQRTQRTQPSEASSAAAPETQSRTRRHSSEQPPAKRPRNLSYSLFPAPIDRSLYLGDAPTKSTTSATAPAPAPALAPAAAPTPALQPPQQDVPQRTETHTSIAPTERGRDSTPKANKTASESQKKKRKRSSSPDVIPNPAGASYGMDLDYFCYSSDSEDDEAEPSAPQTQPRKVDTLGKTALRNAAQTERPASKKVRFDASPEDTPSKRRARATDPYQGRHFVGMGGPQASSAPTTPTPESRVYDPRQRPGFIPNRTGTFELDYDAFSDDSDSSGAASPPSTPAPSDVATVPTSTPHDTQSNQSPAPPSTARPAQTPSTPAKIDDEALARARSQAEKYKPKTPSGLRTASRYSSPLTAASPNLTPNLTPAPSADKITKNVTEKFGDDQFAKDAQWLYENCPSGDLRQLAWPARQPFGEGLNISANSLRILNEIWDPADVDNAYDVFQREYADFKKTLA